MLVGSGGPVIIDLPQAIDAAGNNSASVMLQRDVDNLTAYFGRFAPDLRTTDFGREIWSIYESGKLHPEITLTGCFERNQKLADVGSIIREIDYVIKEQAVRQRYKQAIEQ